MSQTTPATSSPQLDPSLLPVVVIGAGPVGLAAAAHLTERGMPCLVLEAGDHVGSAMADWAHIRTFTPWQYIVDAAAERLLAPTGWTRPAQRQSPTGGEIVAQYLKPLAAVLADTVQTRSRVLAVSREGLDRSRTRGRAERAFVVRVQREDGTVGDLRAQAVIDASGTWGHSNPLGSSGLPALGERAAAEQGLLVGPLPDVLGADRERFAGRTTLVVGMGHSAANSLVALAQLAREVPGTRIVWAIRGQSARRVFGGGTADQLPTAAGSGPTSPTSSQREPSSTSRGSRRVSCGSRRTARASPSSATRRTAYGRLPACRTSRPRPASGPMSRCCPNCASTSTRACRARGSSARSSTRSPTRAARSAHTAGVSSPTRPSPASSSSG